MQQIVMSNPRDAYLKQGILTASPLELIIMLYDGLKKDMLLAKRCIGKSDMASAHKYLMKSQDIVCELINCLDMNYSISNDLLPIYEFLLREFEEINFTKNAERIPPLVEIVSELRDTWQTVNEELKQSVSAPSFKESIG